MPGRGANRTAAASPLYGGVRVCVCIHKIANKTFNVNFAFRKELNHENSLDISVADGSVA
jgi:hypothetical protein